MFFGSYARGDAEEGSDLDFYIERGTVRAHLLCGLYADLEEAFGLPIDLLVSESLSDDFRKEISKEEVLIYDKSNKDLRIISYILNIAQKSKKLLTGLGMIMLVSARIRYIKMQLPCAY